MKKVFILAHALARENAIKAVRSAEEGMSVTLAEPSRSLEQNSAQWPLLQAFADQKQLCINGHLETATADDWKDVLTAAFRNEMRVALGLDGRMVLLGQRTSKFSKRGFSEWLEFLHATAAGMGIDLTYKERENGN